MSCLGHHETIITSSTQPRQVDQIHQNHNIKYEYISTHHSYDTKLEGISKNNIVKGYCQYITVIIPLTNLKTSRNKA